MLTRMIHVDTGLVNGATSKVVEFLECEEMEGSNVEYVLFLFNDFLCTSPFIKDNTLVVPIGRIISHCNKIRNFPLIIGNSFTIN